jgi:peptidyl-prolyl cis-trans isomerase SurA
MITLPRVLGLVALALTPVAAIAQTAGKPGEAAPVVAQQSSTGVAATVNAAVISNYDLDQRTALFIATSGVHPNKDELPQIRAQVLRSLEDEAVETQEANKHKITASKTEVEKTLQNIAADNMLTVDQILGTIGQAGVSPATFLQQISAQIVWQKLVAARYGADVRITGQQVDEAMARLKQGADKPQFLISEIYLAVDKPEDETTVRASAEQMAQQTKQGAPFQTVASQFSQSPSAANGGDVGWVLEGQLADELDYALAQLQPGQITGPIRAEGGYYILLLRDRREPAGTEIAQAPAAAPSDPNAPLPLDRLLIPLPPNADATLKDRAMNLGADLRNRLRSCADLPNFAKQLQGTVFEQLGNMNLKDLTPELRAALAGTGPGEVVKPFFSSAGLELIMRCDGAPPKPGVFQLPSRDQLQQQLAVQQMSIYAKAYLGELRRNAIVYSTIK